ncbi:uncharacterized protein BCR38DRAFT_484941 [Pseudomassariella vexata]|uniref:G-patch domain-containing protein n=1 Tax=Pseudomassariella vexata TaxID=1141098 RepID=A0A1Y2E1U4_9PEZI|nr:uncharacterized protein BCR38DRAFT_484941 [Pseudomassariella vexata]ORY65528.1 hypothetical protein BCR38DRAFT_484941 [Pseudomassariella vexata]
MAGPPPPPRSGGLSLYANLLGPPDESASISRGPIVSKEALDAVKGQAAAAEAKKPVDPSLRFQPFQSIRRPQQKTQRPKVPKVLPANANAPSSGTASTVSTPVAQVPPPAKSTLADWAATEDDDWMYAGDEKRNRGGRRKKKKRDNAPIETDWDEVYDPSRPTNVDEYLRSDERIREVREWKALLYKHKRPAKRQSSWDSEDEEDRPVTNQFAPPGSYSFAPPPPPSPPRASVPDDKSGDDAYARRPALSRGFAPPPTTSASPNPPSAPPPPVQTEPTPTIILPPPPPEADPSTISRAPVRYTQPEPSAPSATSPDEPEPDPDAMDEDTLDPNAADAPTLNTRRPGQKGFAARLMSKYGWTKGQGLGADASGIVQPLRVHVEKRKKKPDAEGGGWAEPGGRGKIIAPKVAAAAAASSSSESKFGPMSNVIVLRHMLYGIKDVQHEISEGLGQEIGEECGDKYGRVERLYIDHVGLNVYIKFVDGVSALRAVNALDGRVFAGNSIAPQFYDLDKFERSVYE